MKCLIFIWYIFSLTLIGDARKRSKNDNYYLIFVNNTSGNSSFSGFNKRQENSNETVYTVLDEIHNLIVNNIDTYYHPEILETMEEYDTKLKKRDDHVTYLMDYGQSSYVYPISSTKDKTVLFSYLSSDLVEVIETIPNVLNCRPDQKRKRQNYYDIRKMKEETNWKDLKIKTNADLHLSLISQGKYNSELVSQYDTNYYYPKSSGEDIDLFIIDGTFNFNHPEFKNRNNRIAKCAANVVNGKVLSPESEDYCYDIYVDFHGAMVSDAAAGLIHGVAKNANIYGINLEDDISFSNEFAAMQYIKDNLFRANKAIINMSFGGEYSIKQLDEDPSVIYERELINELTHQGAIFVSSAGNDNMLVYDEENDSVYLPCAYDDVICVGAI
ncbi:subtilisin-like protein, partial [Piromyces finnis]